MKVLITGSNGMVGKNIIDNKPSGYLILSPTIESLNLLDYNKVLAYLKQNKPDIIIHAAGIVGGIQANIHNQVKFLRENILIAHNVIWAAIESNIDYLINLGSSCMYPKNAPNPLKEEFILKGELEPTNEGYAISKIFAQRFCSYYNHEINNKNFKTIIPCNLYGRYDKFEDNWSHLIPAAIRKIHNAKINRDNKVTIWGDGTARREFMYSVDLAQFIWFAIKNIELIPETMNVGTGMDYSITDYYKVISKIIGYSGEFNYDISKPVGMTQKLVDTSLQSQLGWKPKFSLEHGIKETYDFFKSNYNNI